MTTKRSGTDLTILASILVVGLQVAPAQSTNRVAISRAGSNYVVSWTNRGTLQAAAVPSGPWQDMLEAPNPMALSPTNTHQFFRSISRWSARSNLLEANSEMSVAELNGRIYVMG